MFLVAILAAKCYIGVAFCAVFEFQKSSHLQPLEWPQVAALLSGRKWPPSTRGRGIWISEKAATCSHSQPLEWPQVAALPEWNTHSQPPAAYLSISTWKKNTFPTKHIFSRCSKTIAKKHNLTWTKTKKNTHSQPPTWKKTPTHSRWLKKRRVPS